MKSFVKIITILTVLALVSSCTRDKRERQVQYMADTDMYRPVAYETYGESKIGDSVSVRLPVVGTIARGNVPYDYPNSAAGYLAAKDSLLSPLKIKAPLDSIRRITQKNLDQGKYLYGIYCASCHGIKGDGQGTLVQNEKILGVPNYKDRDVTEGNIYHVLMYGKGIMGSHSSQLSATERWQVVHHVEQLRTDLLK